MVEQVTSPLLFVPGLGCTAEVFVPQISALSTSIDCRVADHSRGATIAAIAADILTAAPPKFALAGFSLGGYIAFEMVRQAPERVERLALLDTQATPETDAARARRVQLMPLMREGRIAEAEQAHWSDVVHASRIGDTALWDIKLRMAQTIGSDLWLRHATAIMDRADSRPTLAAIRVPTLVLVGDDDRLTTPERGREMVAGIAGARLVVVPDCGHMSPIERPDAVTAALKEWLAA